VRQGAGGGEGGGGDVDGGPPQGGLAGVLGPTPLEPTVVSQGGQGGWGGGGGSGLKPPQAQRIAVSPQLSGGGGGRGRGGGQAGVEAEPGAAAEQD